MRILTSIAVLALAVAGCGDDAQPGSSKGGLSVVATTTQVADLTRNAGGERVQVRGLIPPNADPHDYEMRPSDVEALTEADVIVRSGGDLDEWLADAIEAAGAQAPVLTLIDHVKTREGGEHGHEEEEHAGEEEQHAEEEEEHAGEEAGVDPHWWQDPRNAALAVDAIRDALATADPAHAGAYRTSADTYRQRIEALDEAVAACIRVVPTEQRKLVTTHDALGYYAARYGIEVIGAVIPSLSTQAQASAGETADLVETIRREKVRAVFTESSVNAKVEQAIAEDAGAKLGKPLYSDALGPSGSAGETYLGSIAANTEALVEGFTGAPACDLAT